MTAETGNLPVPSASRDIVDPAAMRVIWILIVAAFVAIFNETTMSIAIPQLNITLGIPEEQGQWLTSAFMLMMAVVIPTTGFLLQRFTTRQIFIAAMTAFSIGTAICLVAPGFWVLLTGRVVQAGGTGIMLPLLMTTMMNVVPPHMRGRMMGLVGMVISLAPATGPTASGLILDHLGWRWIFAIVLPIALIPLLLGIKWMTNIGETSNAPIDVLSILLSAVAFGGIVFGLSQLSAEQSGNGIPPLAIIGAGAALLALFVWRQITLQRKDDALLDMRIFTSKNFVVAVTIMTVTAFAMFGSFSLLPLVLQTVSQLDATQTGLVLLPGAVLMGVLGPLMGRIYDARGPKTLLIPGTIMIAVAMFAYAFIDSGTPVWMLITIQIVLSVALAGSFTPLFTASLGSLKRSLYSHGSAALNTLQQVAGAAGTALLIGVYSAILHAGEANGMPAPEAGAQGAHSAFLIGGSIAVLGAILAFFVTKPADDQEDHSEESSEGIAAPMH